MALIEKWERHLPWLMAVLSGVLYLSTMAPTILHTDSGELAAVANTFGVAHPTGYPLFTLMGWLFTRIPIGTVAFKLNLMCLLFVSGSVYFWGRFLREFFINMRTRAKKGDSTSTFRIQMANLSATIAGTLMLAFGQTWWMQSVSVEVYSLQCMLLTMMLFFLLRAWYAKEKLLRHWGLFALALAWCFTNHLTAIVLLPGVLYLFIMRFGFTKEGISMGIKLLGIGVAVLVVFYSMLMIAASSDPEYNWGNPENWAHLWHHMSGKQFSVWMFTGVEAFGKNLLGYLNRLPEEYGWHYFWLKIPAWILLGIMAVQGMVYTYQRRLEWGIFFTVCFAANIFWAANYDIKDPEAYYLVSFLAINFAAAMLLRWAWIGMKSVAPYITAFYMVVIVVQVGFNYGRVNHRGAWQFEDYARAALESLPENSILVTKLWDVTVAPFYYLQGCEGLRKDVDVVDYSLLHDRYWYPEQMRAQSPELAKALGKPLEEWEKAVADFDLRGKANPLVLTPRFDAVYNGILAQMSKRPVYFGPDVYADIMEGKYPMPPKDVIPVPEAYFVRLKLADSAQDYAPIPDSTALIRYGGQTDAYETKLLKEQLRIIWRLRSVYEQNFGFPERAAAIQGRLQALDAR